MPPLAFSGTWLADDDQRARSQRIAGRFDGDHVLVPLLTDEMSTLTDQLEVAAGLARSTGATLSVMNPASVSDQPSKTYRREIPSADDETLLTWALEQTASRTNGGFLSTRNVVSSVLSAVETNDVDTLVLSNTKRRGRLPMGPTDRIAAHADCDVVVVNGRPGYEPPASILLPVAGGPHSGLAADVARSIAADTDAWIDILHVVDEGASDRRRDEATDLVEDVSGRIDRPETTTTWVLEAPDVVEAIAEQSRYYELTILGAPTKSRLRQFVSGSTNRSVRANAHSVVLSARSALTE